MKNEVYVFKNAVSLFLKKLTKSRYIIAFLFQGSRILVSFEVNLLTLECIKLFDGKHTLGQIIETKKITEKEIFQLARYLESQNIIEEKKESTENKRYSRQLNFFSSFENKNKIKEIFQKKIESAHVVVLGAGGIGTWLIESLVRSGVGQFTIIDPDIVNTNNLHRQTFFTEKDIGKYKVDVIKKCATTINGIIKIKIVKKLITSAHEIIPLIKKATIAINCSDYPDVTTTNDLISQACFTHNIPHILCGGYDGHLSFIGQTVIPHKSSCWRCYTEGGIYEKKINGFAPIDINKNPSNEGGTISPVAAITANIHALEAIKVITGYAKPLMINTKAEWNFLSLSMSKTTIPKNKHCSLCGSNAKKGGRK